MKKFAIIVAGGVGQRAGGDIPKQFREVGGKPMLWWSLKAFHDEDPDTSLIVVLHPGFFDLWNSLMASMPSESRIYHTLVAGGSSRWQSVKNGLDSIKEPEGLVAVHDAARPMLTPELAKRMWSAAEKVKAAIPVVPVVDSLRQVDSDGNYKAVDRSRFRIVQTPQTFSLSVIRKAYTLPESAAFTDDASVAEAAGFTVTLEEGIPENIKVTNPRDFAIADLLLNTRRI